MSMEDRALAARQEQQDEQREEAQRDALRNELRDLRIKEEAKAATVLAFSRALRREWTEPDPPDVLWAWRDAVDRWAEARDTADAYQREHGL